MPVKLAELPLVAPKAPGEIPRSIELLSRKINEIVRTTREYADELHATEHYAGGSDPLTLTSLVGDLPVARVTDAVGTTDPRLSDARTPLAHAASHHSGGTDALSLPSIAGVLTKAQQHPETAYLDSVAYFASTLAAGGTPSGAARFEVNGGAGTFVNAFNLHGAGTGTVFGRLSNTDTAGRAVWAFGETSANTATPAFIQRHGSTHATKPNVMEYIVTGTGAWQAWMVGGTSAEKMRLLSNAHLLLGTTTDTAMISLVAATTAAGGLAFGTDTNFYRSAADRLRTDDSLSVGAAAVVGAAAPDASALLDLVSTTKFLLLPRMTTVQRDAVTATPLAGSTLYNSTAGKVQTYDGALWRDHW